LPADGFGRMILFVPTAVARTRRSRCARDFADLRKTADPRTEKRSLLVNLDKQPTFVHRPDGSQIAFTYDSAGRLWTTTYPSVNGNVTVTRTYSPTTGQLTGVTTSDGQSLAYGYDGSLLKSTTWSGNVAGSVSRTYNNDFRVASESVNGANSVAYGYDNDGLLTSADGLTITRDATNGMITDTTLGGVTDHRTYDSFGQVAAYEAKFGATSLYSVVHTRDSLGRIETKTETIQGTATVWGYSYDSAGRLWQVMRDGVLRATYLYDANGNRLSKTTPTGSEIGTYDNQDRLLTYGKWAYSYTANGELRTKTDTSTGAITTYSYDGAGNLRKVELPDGRVVEYVIDSSNRRVGKKVNGSIVKRWLYQGRLTPVAELDSNGAMVSRFAGGGVIKGSTSHRVVADHLGSPRLVVNTSTGAIIQRLEHDEWGVVTADTAAGFTPFGFAVGISDEDTGLVRFGARDYDPEAGRWTAKDPIRFGGGQANFFTYVMADPVNFVDPLGLDSLWYSQPGGTVYWLNDSGTVDETFSAKSGPFGNGPLEPGDYDASNMRNTNQGGMVCPGQPNGWKVDLDPQFQTNRTDLRIHPDGPPPGTKGCIGISCADAQRFHDRLDAYLQANGSIPVQVTTY
jgi:RHS repeat-associated protein